MQKFKKITVYCDGGCMNNGRKNSVGAYAYAVTVNNVMIHSEASTFQLDTTNNKMELNAATKALDYCKNFFFNDKITVYTDSQYVCNGITSWINKWKKNGWKNQEKEPVKNSDLWKELDSLYSNLDVEFRWVKGHNGHEMNEYVDELCSDSINSYFTKIEY